MKSAHKKAVVGKVIVYVILILIALIMIIPFLWMLSASIKSDRQVFQMNPFVWIPENPKIRKSAIIMIFGPKFLLGSLWEIRFI